MSRWRSESPNKIFILVFSIAFGLLALALGYQAVMNSSDIRSKAAQTQTMYKQWEFNGQNTEGWLVDAPHTGKVNSGAFLLATAKGKQLPAMNNTSVSTRLPSGIKSVVLMMAVGKINPPVKTPSSIPTTMGRPNIQEVRGETQESDAAVFNQTVKARLACAMDAKTCPDGSMVGRSGPTCQFLSCPPSIKKPLPTTQTGKRFTGLLYTQSGNKKQYEKPVEFSGTANGMLQQYTINLPAIQATDITKMRIVFTSGIQAGETISIDWIRLTGAVLKETPTLTPPVGCRYENVICVKAPCDPILVCSSPTPTPPVGCRYEQVICVKAPCDPILVCSTPTPTCIPVPECVYNPPIVNGKPVYCSPPIRSGARYCPRPTISSTPTPSVACKTGVNSFGVDTACTGGYQYMTFRCYDGFGRREGGPSSCKSSEVWSSYAQQYCQGHSSCPVTVTPTPDGCYEKQVWCFKEPCPKIMVCP